MIRLTAAFGDDRFVYTLTQDGAAILSSTSSADVAERMLQLGIADPLQLVQAAEEWGVVEIKEGEG